MNNIVNFRFSINFYSITTTLLFMVLCNSNLHSTNNFILQESDNISKVKTFYDTCKTILVYTVSNITDNTVAKIEVKIVVRNKKIINAVANVIENKIDSVNSVTGLVLSIENDFVILKVKMNTELEHTNKNQHKWVGDMEISIFLGLTTEGSIKSFTLNDNADDSNLRFGGDFSDQSKGVFRTKSIYLK